MLKIILIIAFLMCAVGSLADSSGDDWNMVFRGTSGNGHNVYQAWVFGTGTSDIKPTNMERSCGPHYRSPLIKIWKFLNIRKVKLAFFENEEQTAYIVFDGRGSDSMNWFSKHRLLFSSWCDLSPNRDYNYFSLAGDRDAGRSFFIKFINFSIGCDNDRVHVATIDTVASARYCLWDKQPAFPQFLYSKINHADYARMLGRADFMAVYIEK